MDLVESEKSPFEDEVLQRLRHIEGLLAGVARTASPPVAIGCTLPSQVPAADEARPSGMVTCSSKGLTADQDGSLPEVVVTPATLPLASRGLHAAHGGGCVSVIPVEPPEAPALVAEDPVLPAVVGAPLHSVSFSPASSLRPPLTARQEPCPFSPAERFGRRGIWDRVSSMSSTKLNIGPVRSQSKVSAESLQRKVSTYSRARPMTMRWKQADLFLNDAESSTPAMIFATLDPAIAIVSAVFALQQTLGAPIMAGLASFYLELSFDSLFLSEVTLRFLASPRRRLFFMDSLNLVDVANALPFFLRVACWGRLGGVDTSPDRAVLILMVPILRLLKLLRRVHSFRLIFGAGERVIEALPSLLFAVLLMILAFSSAVYLVEPRDSLASWWDAAWFVMVTMTTVGYGDIVPQSAAGKCITGVLVFCSVLYMAMPLGIIGATFTEVWADRDRVLLRHRFLKKMRHIGYEAEDVVDVLKLFDVDDDGSINFEEFCTMLGTMGLGLKSDRAAQLFGLFDNDGSGELSTECFLKTLFPKKFLTLKSAKAKEDSDAGEGEGTSARPGGQSSPSNTVPSTPGSCIRTGRSGVAWLEEASN